MYRKYGEMNRGIRKGKRKKVEEGGQVILLKVVLVLRTYQYSGEEKI